MRLTPTELEKVLKKWERLFAPEGESEHQFLYSLICEAEDAKGIQGHLPELKPDRRAEVLELAGELAAAYVSTLASKGYPTEKIPKEAGELAARNALAIINAVDEATGAKASEADDPVMLWKVTEPDQNGEFGVWRGSHTCAIEGVHRPMADAVCNTLNALATRGVNL